MWINCGTQATVSLPDKQGSEVVLDDVGRECKLVVNRLDGEECTLGVWGRDARGHTDLIYHGPCDDGQVIPVRGHYREVHAAANLVRDEPPVTRRWQIQEEWYRQAGRPGRIELEKWIAE